MGNFSEAPARYHERVTSELWRCPLCNTLAENAREHLSESHGVGSDRDRFGLRDAARRQSPPPGRDADRADRDDDADEPGPGARDEVGERGVERFGTAFEPPVWRRVAPSTPRRNRNGGFSRPADDPFSDPPLTWRKARRPSSTRRGAGEPAEMPPAKPIPIPPDAAVLRLVCETLEGVDASALRDRLLNLSGVESVALDLYARTVDLYLDRQKATPPHLVALARERVRLPVRVAELHRSPERGQSLGEATLLFVIQ
jgi:hypothetical protein